MKILIVGSGKIENTQIIHKYLSQNYTIICCDGGSEYLFAEGIVPSYILGDLDSSKKPIIDFFKSKNVCLKKFEVEKNDTDMGLCIDFAISLLPEEVVIVGGLGSRFDHSITNIHMLIKLLNNNIKASIINDNNEIFVINKSIEIIGRKDDVVSLVPISEKVEGVTTCGLYYPLENATLYIEKSRGVSNVMLTNIASVSIKSGYLLVIKSKD